MRHRAPALSFLSLVVGLYFAATPLFAHHGAAEYDTKASVTLNGEVTELRFSNPHVQLYFEVKNAKGEVEKWQGELPAPNTLIRVGWNKRTLKPGDSVVVFGFRVHGGAHGLWIGKLLGPDQTAILLFDERSTTSAP